MVHFCYSTGDAGGMNMIARATDRACRWLVDNSAGAAVLSLQRRRLGEAR